MGFGLGGIVDSVFPGLGSVIDSGSGFIGGTVDSVTGKLTGSDAAKASAEAAKIQAESADKALALTKETRDLAREDLSPFKDFGAGQLGALGSILTKQGQEDFLMDNPLLQASLDSVNQATMASQAARGKLGSGGTLAALQNNYLASAMPILQNQQNQLFNAANMGQSAAAGQANTALNTGNSLANITTQQGNALGSGVVGAANAKQNAFNSLLGLGGQLGGAYLGGVA